jgi:hypothetical protein
MCAAPVSLESPPSQESPELELWREVLLLAIMDCRGQLGRHDKRHAQERAQAWIFSTREDPGSFKWCCDVLGLDPRMVQRQALPAHCEESPAPPLPEKALDVGAVVID